MSNNNANDMCKVKVRYGSDAAAQADLKRINPMKKLKKPSRAYKCPTCSGWHLTSKSKK